MEATPDEYDARFRHLTLTPKGRKALVPLELSSDTEVRAALKALSGGQQDRLVDAMRTIEKLLDETRDSIGAHGLRDPRPGDFGWVISHHGVVYAREQGWDERFEGLVAEIVARYLRSRDPARERCWIAERGGERVGSVFVVERGRTVAQLRLLLVDPSARGSGLGSRLVDEAIRFARAAGYLRIMLSTQASLRAACHICKKKGFRLVKREKQRETYSLALTIPAR